MSQNNEAANVLAWAFLKKPLDSVSASERADCLGAAQSIGQLFEANQKVSIHRIMEVAGITPDHPKFDDLFALGLWGDEQPVGKLLVPQGANKGP